MCRNDYVSKRDALKFAKAITADYQAICINGYISGSSHLFIKAHEQIKALVFL